MNTTDTSSTKPYLLRAIFEWAEDNGYTPQVLVNALAADVKVPQAHIVDGQIVLNISSTAVQLHIMDNQCLSFSARFSGIEQDIFLPIDSIMAIFARENSQGIFFEEQERAAPVKESGLSAVSKNNAKPTSQSHASKSADSQLQKKPSSEKISDSKVKKDKKDDGKRGSSHLKIIK